MPSELMSINSSKKFMKTKMFQTKRRAKSGFRLLQAKTRKKRKQRVSAAASNHDFAVEEPNLGVARALVVILILHLAAIAAIIVHHNTTKDDIAVKETPVANPEKRALAAPATERAQIGPNDRWKWVDKGDTYERVAREYQVDVAELRRLNKGNPLVLGMALKLPPEQAVAAIEPLPTPPADPILSEQLPPIVDVPTRSGIPAEYEVVAAAQEIAPTRQPLPSPEPVVQEPRVALPIEPVVSRPVVQEAPKPKPASRSYTVKSGDNLWSIAKRNGISLAKLEAANPRINPRNMKIGSKLVIPAN